MPRSRRKQSTSIVIDAYGSNNKKKEKLKIYLFSQKKSEEIKIVESWEKSKDKEKPNANARIF